MLNLPDTKIIQVLNDYEVVINKGEEDKISRGNKFLIYYLGEEMHDPETGESLGNLEIVCGKAKVKHIQPKITTLISDEYTGKTINKTNRRPDVFSYGLLGRGEENESESIRTMQPFYNIGKDCLIKKLN